MTWHGYVQTDFNSPSSRNEHLVKVASLKYPILLVTSDGSVYRTWNHLHCFSCHQKPVLVPSLFGSVETLNVILSPHIMFDMPLLSCCCTECWYQYWCNYKLHRTIKLQLLFQLGLINMCWWYHFINTKCVTATIYCSFCINTIQSHQCQTLLLTMSLVWHAKEGSPTSGMTH